MSTTTTIIPAWLRAATNIELDDEEQEEEEQQENKEACWTSVLPTCELDCTDGELYYLTLSAWSVDWAKVSLPHFLPAWFALSNKRRKKLLRSRRVFADMIGEHWIPMMLQRDDAAMLAVVIGGEDGDGDGGMPEEKVRQWINSFVADGEAKMMNDKITSSLGTACARLNAIKCLEVYLHSRFFEEDFDRCQTLRFFEGMVGLNHVNLGALEMAVLAAKHGQLALLKILDRFDGNNENKWYSDRITNAAAVGGHLECLQFLCEKNYYWDRSRCLRIVTDDRTRSWIVEQQDSWDKDKYFIHHLMRSHLHYHQQL